MAVPHSQNAGSPAAYSARLRVKVLITTAIKLTIKLKNYCSYNTHPANVA